MGAKFQYSSPAVCVMVLVVVAVAINSMLLLPAAAGVIIS
jgi:hypothetical protein